MTTKHDWNKYLLFNIIVIPARHNKHGFILDDWNYFNTNSWLKLIIERRSHVDTVNR